MKSGTVQARVASCCLVLVCCSLLASAATTRLSPLRGRTVQSRVVAPVAALAVDIDVQSVEPDGAIDLASTGAVHVAILGSRGFDATAVDPSTLTASGASAVIVTPGSAKPGTRDQLADDVVESSSGYRAPVYDAQVRDVNSDGRPDLVVAFSVARMTDLVAGLGRVQLEGRTFGGLAIAGTQAVVARGTRPSGCCDGNHPESPAATACNTSPITINDGTAATPYPSSITVSGETGVISNITVSVTGLSHAFIGDVQMLLVGPAGQKVVLMAVGTNGSAPSGINLTFDDAAAANLPATGAFTSGTFKPTVNDALPNFAAPAPAASVASPFAYTLSAFRGTNPNGTWSLYVRDITAPDGGSISGGWCVNITTAPSATACATLQAGAIGAGDLTQTGRLTRNGVTSICAVVKPSPGLNDSTPGRRFDTYTITNQNVTSQCVSASLTTGCAPNQIFLAAYSGSYNPASVLTNYLADNGSSIAGSSVGISPVAFTMAPGATVVLVVHEITVGQGCSSYGLLIEGDICAPPSCTLTCPANVTQANDPNQCGAVVNYPAPTATPGCGTVTCVPPSGSTFAVGTTTVTCTPTTGTPCSFTVTVNDTQAPTITCPANQTALESPPGSGTATVNFPAPTVADNCPGVGTVVCAPPSGSAFPLGTTTVTCTVSDAAANTANCTFTVTVEVPFDLCFNDEANGNTLSFVTDPLSPQYGLWQFRIAATGTVLSGYAEHLAYRPNISLSAYDRDTAAVRMDANANLAAHTCTATIVNRTTGVRYTFRDRNTTNNPACGAPAP